jgi:hypothetical protein
VVSSEEVFTVAPVCQFLPEDQEQHGRIMLTDCVKNDLSKKTEDFVFKQTQVYGAGERLCRVVVRVDKHCGGDALTAASLDWNMLQHRKFDHSKCLQRYTSTQHEGATT